LFVGTKKQAQEPVADQASRVGMPYVNHRWLGGMLTNFSTVHKRLQRLKELEEIDFDDVANSGLTKKELLMMRREKDKLSRTLGGIRDMAKVPSAVWVVDTNKEHLAVDEARKLGIPVIAILDTNCDPDMVEYAIPGNDDAIRAVTLLTRVVADAVAEGLLARHSGKAAAAEAEPLAEWERELLAGAEADADAAVAAPVAEASVAQAPVTEVAVTEAPVAAAVVEAAAVEEAAVEEAPVAEAAVEEAGAEAPAEAPAAAEPEVAPEAEAPADADSEAPADAPAEAAAPAAEAAADASAEADAPAEAASSDDETK
jgi:small subunit ribosomal protein S2